MREKRKLMNEVGTVFMVIVLAMSVLLVGFGSSTVEAESSDSVPWQTEDEYQSHIDETKLDLEGTMRYSVYDHTRDMYIVVTYNSDDYGNWHLYHIDDDGSVEHDYEHTNMDGRPGGSYVTDEGTLLISSRGNLRDDDEDQTTAGIYRSTDGGETLTEVKDKVACWEFTEDKTNDVLYAGNYWDYNPWQDDISEYIWKSTDDGETWTSIWDCEEFDNQTDDWYAKNESLERQGFKHIHGLQYSPSHNALYVIGGDGYMDNNTAGGKKFGVLKADGEPSQTSDFTWMSRDSQWDSTTYYDNDVYLGCSNDEFSISRIVDDVDNADDFSIDHLVSGTDTSIYQSTTMYDGSGNELGVFSTRYGGIDSIVVTDGEVDLTIQNGTTNYMTWSHGNNMDGLIATAPDDYDCTAVLYQIDDFDNLKKPLPVEDAEDFEGIYGSRRRNYVLTDDIDFSEVDKTLEERKYIFSHIDGNGHKINNVNKLIAERVMGGIKNVQVEYDRDVYDLGYGSVYKSISYGLKPVEDSKFIGETTLSAGISGGIAGYITRDFKNNYVDLHVTVKSLSDDGRIGGLFGYSRSSANIENCIVDLNADGSGNNVQFGSFIGSMGGSTMNDCRLYGEIIISDSKIGGLIGKGIGTIKNSVVNATIESGGSVGGIAGHNQAEGKLSILNSAYIGSLEGGYYTGGIVYTTEPNETHIENCYVRGSIFDSSDAARTGGIVGNYLQYNATIINTYVLADVDSDGHYKQRNVICGYIIASDANNTVVMKDIYYNQTVVDKFRLYRDSDNEPDTEIVYEEYLDNMTKESTYENWTFDDPWVIDEDRNDNYPYLKGEEYVNIWTERPENIEDEGADLKADIRMRYVDECNLSFKYREHGSDEWNETDNTTITESGTYSIDTGSLDGERYYEYKSVASYNPTIEGGTYTFYEEDTIEDVTNRTIELIVAVIPMVVIIAVVSLVIKLVERISEGGI